MPPVFLELRLQRRNAHQPNKKEVGRSNDHMLMTVKSEETQEEISLMETEFRNKER